jgi:hypothetical protein
MDRRNSRRARDICIATHGRDDEHGRFRMICHCGQPGCKKIIDPVRDQWRADHIRRWSEGGRDTPGNIWPILVACDAGAGGKAAADTKAVAHGKRASRAHYGGSRRRNQKAPPMAGSRDSPWKKRMDGTVVRRDGR